MSLDGLRGVVQGKNTNLDTGRRAMYASSNQTAHISNHPFDAQTRLILPIGYNKAISSPSNSNPVSKHHRDQRRITIKGIQQ